MVLSWESLALSKRVASCQATNKVSFPSFDGANMFAFLERGAFGKKYHPPLPFFVRIESLPSFRFSCLAFPSPFLYMAPFPRARLLDRHPPSLFASPSPLNQQSHAFRSPPLRPGRPLHLHDHPMASTSLQSLLAGPLPQRRYPGPPEAHDLP